MEKLQITAVILAAGQARRMGTAKQLLAWGNTTVLGQTIRHVQETAVSNIIVVSGHCANKVEKIANEAGVAVVHNPNYAEGEMLSSLQTAVSYLPDTVDAILVVLADQPMIKPKTYNAIIKPFQAGTHDLIAPFYQGKKGNPVLIGRAYFDELMTLPPGDAPRTLLKRHASKLLKLDSQTDTILRDLDTPTAYEKWRPQ